jgi:hypothetical protein
MDSTSTERRRNRIGSVPDSQTIGAPSDRGSRRVRVVSNNSIGVLARPIRTAFDVCRGVLRKNLIRAKVARRSDERLRTAADI